MSPWATRTAALRIKARQVAAMQRAGLIDLRRPDRIVRTVRTMSTLGPIAAGVAMSARRCPNKTAIVDDAGALTYRQIDSRTDQIAMSWRSEGFGEDSCIAVMCRDNRGLVETIVAVAKLGARLVLMNTGFSAAQFADVAARENVDMVVSDPEFADLARELPNSMVLRHPVGSAESIRPVGRPPRPSRPGTFVMLTGGTTGAPKGAPRRVDSSFAGAQFVDRVPLRRGRTVLLCAPLFHGTSLSQFILSMNLGCTVVLHGRFDARRALAQIESFRCDQIVVVPTMLRRILDLDDDIGRIDASCLKIIFCAGAALPTTLGARAMEVFGPVLYNFYGTTETGTATISTPEDWVAAPGTVGKAPVGITVALFDENGRRVNEPKIPGTVHVGNSIAFTGYSGGGSKATITGLMSTGDIGHWDAGGRLFIDGRDDDMIVSGGENVFPGEVEDVLHSHNAIVDVAVVGVHDDEFGQRLSAFVVRGAELQPSEVRAFVRDHLARFKVPRDVTFLDELPRTVTGKIDRARITALALSISAGESNVLRFRTATGSAARHRSAE